MKKQETPLCNHVKANGTVCESPALKDESLCFFHKSARERVKRQRRAQRNWKPFQLPVLEDAESIQLAIGDTLNALLAGQIDHKTAGLLLYGLQTAAGNVRHTRFWTTESSRRFAHYHNQEEETLEQEIQQEIEAERVNLPEAPPVAAQEPASAPLPKDQPLPPKKSVERQLPEEPVASHDARFLSERQVALQENARKS